MNYSTKSILDCKVVGHKNTNKMYWKICMAVMFRAHELHEIFGAHILFLKRFFVEKKFWLFLQHVVTVTPQKTISVNEEARKGKLKQSTIILPDNKKFFCHIQFSFCGLK